MPRRWSKRCAKNSAYLTLLSAIALLRHLAKYEKTELCDNLLLEGTSFAKSWTGEQVLGLILESIAALSQSQLHNHIIVGYPLTSCRISWGVRQVIYTLSRYGFLLEIGTNYVRIHYRIIHPI